MMVALNGLENVLKVGESEAKSIGVPNKYALEVEECFGKHSAFTSCLVSCIFMMVVAMEIHYLGP